MKTILLTIDKLVSGGMGLARTPNGVVFVRDSIAGEQIEVEMIRKQGGVPVAQPVTIITPSPFRRIPPCPHAHVCGGCDWQHIQSTAQIGFKQQIVEDCLRRIGKLATMPAFELFSANDSAYRWRVQFTIDHHNNRMGFFARHSKEVVNVDHCPVLIAPLNQLLLQKSTIIQKSLSYDGQLKAIGSLQGSIATSPHSNEVSSDHINLSVGSKTFSVSGSSFFQANALLVEQLATWAKPYIQGDRFVDLYGGVGLFSVMLGEQFKVGIMVESDPEQVTLAHKNLLQNDITSVRAIAMKSEQFITAPDFKDADCVIVDPPRTGLDPLVSAALLNHRSRQLLYISCNPSTLARDLNLLVVKGNYKINRAAIFDLYPQTSHVECAVLMTR